MSDSEPNSTLLLYQKALQLLDEGIQIYDKNANMACKAFQYYQEELPCLLTKLLPIPVPI